MRPDFSQNLYNPPPRRNGGNTKKFVAESIQTLQAEASSQFAPGAFYEAVAPLIRKVCGTLTTRPPAPVVTDAPTKVPNRNKQALCRRDLLQTGPVCDVYGAERRPSGRLRESNSREWQRRVMASRSRGGRRRRVLTEEVRAHCGPSADTLGAGDADAPRYGEQASIENHPQITDYIPRKRRVVFAVVALIVGIAVAGQSLAGYATLLADTLPTVSADTLRDRISGGLLAWVSATVLLIAAAAARITYSLRRHRVDDQHGRYRAWRWAALGALAASVNTGVQLQDAVGRLGAEISGWSLTGGGVEWWLAPLTIIGMWVAVRILLEMKESPLALACGMLAVFCYAVSAAGTLGWTPIAAGPFQDGLTRSLPLVGHSLALASFLLFARYVVLDVQGLIEHRPAQGLRLAEQTADPPAAKPASTKIKAEREPEVAAAESQWVDGSEPEIEDQQPRRKLSKAERKRLRKQKMKNKAA